MCGQKKEVTTRLGHLWLEQGSTLSKSSKRGFTKAWGEGTPKLEVARAQRDIYISSNQEFDDIMKNAKHKLKCKPEHAEPFKAEPVNDL